MSLLKKAVASSPNLDELIRAETATKSRLDGLGARQAQLKARLACPEPDDTRETLAPIAKELTDIEIDLSIAKGNHDRAAAARAEAEKVAVLDQVLRESDRLAACTGEIVKTTPSIVRKHVLELLQKVADFTSLDQQIVEVNKKRAKLGMGPLPLSEHLMRGIPGTPNQTVEEEVETEELPEGSMVHGRGVATKKVRKKKTRTIYGRHPITPTPYAQILRIPGFAPGEDDYRVAGSLEQFRGIWIDACGRARQF
jgi:hypothetical protein